MKKKFLIAGLVLAAIVLLGWLYINKSHRSATDTPDIVIGASALFDAFATDEASANKKFLDKLIQVEGVVIEKRQNQEGKDVIVLGTNDPIFGISCTFITPITNKAIGDTLKIKGFCSGYLSDVVLVQCITN